MATRRGKVTAFSDRARLKAGYLLRQLQSGQNLELPHSRALPTIGAGCHELRIKDHNQTWRIIYRIDPDAIVILEVFSKKTPRTPKHIINKCRHRLQRYDEISSQDT